MPFGREDRWRNIFIYSLSRFVTVLKIIISKLSCYNTKIISISINKVEERKKMSIVYLKTVKPVLNLKLFINSEIIDYI